MTNIDELTKRVQDLVGEIDTFAKARHTYSFTHSHDGDDGDGDYEDVSNTSMSADDDSDEENDNDDMEKATINAAVMRNDRATRPGELPVSDHFKQKHKFEALVDHVKNEQGIPKSQAMAYARQTYPDVYRSYLTNSEATAKRAPDDPVEAEMMAKGVTREVAMQRLAQLHGFRAFDNSRVSKRVARAEDAENALLKVAEEVWLDNDIDRCSALRKARLDNPRLHRVLTRG
jgi:hypothetical protein